MDASKIVGFATTVRIVVELRIVVDSVVKISTWLGNISLFIIKYKATATWRMSNIYFASCVTSILRSFSFSYEFKRIPLLYLRLYFILLQIRVSKFCYETKSFCCNTLVGNKMHFRTYATFIYNSVSIPMDLPKYCKWTRIWCIRPVSGLHRTTLVLPLCAIFWNVVVQSLPLVDTLQTPIL